jgi:NTP pyrophosphatase (non-canonical NTP hydrolase)
LALDFRRARDWEQFHTPQNLAIAVSVEAGELLEQFQWVLSPDARPAQARMASIEQEVADIAMLLSYLAYDLGIDVDAAVQRKLALNEERYPVEKSRGTATKYDAL